MDDLGFKCLNLVIKHVNVFGYLLQIFRLRTSLWTVCSDFEGVAIAVEPQAGSLRDPQQRSRDSAPSLELSGVAHIARDLDRIFSRGGEARGDVAGSGRLAPRALRRAVPPVAPRPRAPLQRPQLTRQDSSREARRVGPLRSHRSSPAARLLRYHFS